MSTVKANTISPDDPTQDITLGVSGDTVTLPGNDLRVNTVKDKGGNTLWVSDGSGNLSSVISTLTGNEIVLSTQTVTNQASISFTSDIDSTYDVYIFKFININPATVDVEFEFQVSTNAGVSYGVTTTSTYWQAIHTEAGSHALTYHASYDLTQSTDYQTLGNDLGNAVDECLTGELLLFAPSSTTYIKHFYSNTSLYDTSGAQNSFSSGYVNSTSDVDAINFRMNSGNFDGTITMSGLL